jgi:hypothetical protein
VAEKWTVEFTPQAARWRRSLGADDANQFLAAVRKLQERGPTLGRPYADRIKGSRHHNMKELRPLSGNVRALFAFDPHRRAVVLVGGDKTNDWKGWYRRNIRVADERFDQHLRSLGKEDSCRRSPTRVTGRRSSARER